MSRKIILLEHMSLDGFVGESMDWVLIDDEMFEFVGTIVNEADTALYGRNTYEIMQNYWPTADQKPNASKHDRDHAKWYKAVTKLVISTTMKEAPDDKTVVIGENIAERIAAIKKQPGKNILMLGSPSAAQLLTQNGLIDEYWIFLNPVAIGGNIPLFKQQERMKLQLAETKLYPNGVIALHYKL